MDDLRLLEEQETLFSFKRRRIELELDFEEYELKKKRARLTKNVPDPSSSSSSTTATPQQGGTCSAAVTTTSGEQQHSAVIDLTSDEPLLRIKEEPGVAGEVDTPGTSDTAQDADNIDVKDSVPEQNLTTQSNGNDQVEESSPKNIPEPTLMEMFLGRADAETSSTADPGTKTEQPDIAAGPTARKAHPFTERKTRGVSPKTAPPPPYSPAPNMTVEQPAARTQQQDSVNHKASSDRSTPRLLPGPEFVQRRLPWGRETQDAEKVALKKDLPDPPFRQARASPPSEPTRPARIERRKLIIKLSRG